MSSLNDILKKFNYVLSPFTTVMAAVVFGVWQDSEVTSRYLSGDSRVIVSFIFTFIILMYETLNNAINKSAVKIDLLANQMRVQSLKGAVNSLYSRFEASGDEWITNEYTIKELAELTDLLKELGVNSYTQARISYLNTRVKR